MFSNEQNNQQLGALSKIPMESINLHQGVKLHSKLKRTIL